MNIPIRVNLDGRPPMNGHLEKALEAIPGVQAVEIDREQQCALVEHDGADPGRLLAAAAEEGFQATVV